MNETYPAIKADAKKAGALIFGSDETSLKQDANWVRGWLLSMRPRADCLSWGSKGTHTMGRLHISLDDVKGIFLKYWQRIPWIVSLKQEHWHF